MFDIFQFLAEQKIQEAEKRGIFQDLPGKGRPLEIEDLSHVPPELRLAYKILKNAGFLPPEIETAKEIQKIEDLLEHLEEEEHKYRQIRRLNYLIMKLNQWRRRPICLEKEQRYYDKLIEKTKVWGSKKARAQRLEEIEEKKIRGLKLKNVLLNQTIAKLYSKT